MTKGKTDQYMLFRNLRSGSWYSVPSYCRSASRGGNRPDFRLDYYGFRVVRVPKPLVKEEQEKARKEG